MTQKVSIGNISQFEAGKLTKVDANGTSVVVTVVGDRICAVRNRCSHFPLALAGGTIEGDMIVCPNHGSKFDLCTGEAREWVTSAEGVSIPKFLNRMVIGEPKNIEAYKVTVEGDEAFIEL